MKINHRWMRVVRSGVASALLLVPVACSTTPTPTVSEPIASAASASASPEPLERVVQVVATATAAPVAVAPATATPPPTTLPPTTPPPTVTIAESAPPSPSAEPVPTATAIPTIDPELAAALDAVLERHRGAAGAPGALLAVSLPGGQTWVGASGHAARDQALPMDGSHRFRIASLSKMFVATVVLQLVEEGRLSLDDPVSTWLPGSVASADTMTVRHLMNHTSGVYDYLMDPDFINSVYANPTRVWTPQEIVAYAAQRGPNFQPGAQGRWQYSSTNYVMLGMIVEAITDTPLAQEIRQRILDPLDLNDTFFTPDEPVQGVLARGYSGARDRTDIHMSFGWATGSIVSTAEDVGRFARALLTEDLLQPASRDRMFTFVNANGSFGMPELEYGLGVMRNRLPVEPGPDGAARPAGASTVLGHMGGIGGYRSGVWYVPESGITMVAAFNDARPDPLQLMTDALDTILVAEGQ